MIYGSVCSGIEAATVAWHPLGWKPAFFSEIDQFPRAVLAHYYPGVALHGDFTTIGADDYGSIDLLVGGTPCQSFSVAGLRKGMDDDRGNLALEFLKLAERKRARWLVWENVPGVLSSNGGRDFGSFLGGLGELGYGWAYRVLDAQYFGVPQRRRRVFVVGYLGDWRPPRGVLFERHSLQGHPAPRRETQQAIAEGTISRALTSSHTATGRLDPNEMTFIPSVIGGGVARALTANDSNDPNDKTYVAMPINTQIATRGEALGEGTGFGIGEDGDSAFTIQAAHSHGVAFAENSRHELRLEGGDGQVTGALSTGGGKPGQGYPAVATNMAVRRLTPVECERLQGFPDNYTQIPYRNKPADQCHNGPRCKALGNSMAVPVMRWIGERIQAVEDIMAIYLANGVKHGEFTGPPSGAHGYGTGGQQ